MKLSHHASLRAIGGSLSALHTCKEREYWTIPQSAESEFYDIRDTIGFDNLLSGFRDSGFIVYLDKPKVTDSLIAAAPDLLAALETSLAWVKQYHNLKGHEAASHCMAAVIERALAKARGA